MASIFSVADSIVSDISTACRIVGPPPPRRLAVSGDSLGRLHVWRRSAATSGDLSVFQQHVRWRHLTALVDRRQGAQLSNKTFVGDVRKLWDFFAMNASC